MMPASFDTVPAFLAATGDSAVGTKEFVFLGLWVLFSSLYWSTYKKEENLPMSAVKVGLLLGFVYSVISAFDWMQEVVPAEEVATIWGLLSPATADGPRVPFMGSAFTYFVVGLLLVAAAASPVLSPFIYTLF